jgi:hypothetical protein
MNKSIITNSWFPKSRMKKMIRMINGYYSDSPMVGIATERITDNNHNKLYCEFIKLGTSFHHLKITYNDREIVQFKIKNDKKVEYTLHVPSKKKNIRAINGFLTAILCRLYPNKTMGNPEEIVAIVDEFLNSPQG